MTWLPLLGLLALGGVFYKFSRSPEQPGGEYRTHLTKEERLALAQGRTLIKTHRAYSNIWHTGYHTGTL